jgi:single-stranded DNA-binding protein
LIDGKLSWQSWTDQEGVKKSKVFITVEKINSLKAFSKTGDHDEQPAPEEHANGHDGFSDCDIPF